MTDPAKPAASGEPTPAELRALLAEATVLQGRINDIQQRLRASEETQYTAFRLDDAAGWVAQAGRALGATASDLARTRAARDPILCDIPWGVCPVHGNTLRGTGGRTWCTDPTCGRSWGRGWPSVDGSHDVEHPAVDLLRVVDPRSMARAGEVRGAGLRPCADRRGRRRSVKRRWRRC